VALEQSASTLISDRARFWGAFLGSVSRERFSGDEGNSARVAGIAMRAS
jgi:hypothetical protein